MTVYGLSGVRHVQQVIHRCQGANCRAGFFHGYKILKGGAKVFDDDCLDPKNEFLNISCTQLNVFLDH